MALLSKKSSQRKVPQITFEKKLKAAVHWHRPVASGTRGPQAFIQIEGQPAYKIDAPLKFQELEVLPSLTCVLTGSFYEVIDIWQCEVRKSHGIMHGTASHHLWRSRVLWI